MARYVAFLRAVNVGGRTVTMDRLRAPFESLGFGKVETFIASGNVIFEAPARKSSSTLERGIEKALADSLGYEVRTFIRSEAELAAIAAHPAFPPATVAKATVVTVGFMAAGLDPAARKKLAGYASEVDDFHANGREVYWLCRTRQSESPFFKVPFEKHFGVATFRNMNTVRRILEKYQPAG